MRTPYDIVVRALKFAGVVGQGQTPSAEELNDAFDIMNDMLAVWQAQRYLVWNLVDVSCPATGAISYDVGPGLDFDTPRPDRLEAAYVRLVNNPGNQVDYPLDVLQSHEDYAEIAIKSLRSFPSYVFYDSAFPTGSVFIWPVPTNLYEVHLLVKQQLKAFADLRDPIALPAEYFEALAYNLAARIKPLYGQPADDTIIALAQKSLSVIRGSNTQIPRLTIDPRLTSGRWGYGGGGWYGIGAAVAPPPSTPSSPSNPSNPPATGGSTGGSTGGTTGGNPGTNPPGGFILDQSVLDKDSL